MVVVDRGEPVDLKGNGTDGSALQTGQEVQAGQARTVQDLAPSGQALPEGAASHPPTRSLMSAAYGNASPAWRSPGGLDSPTVSVVRSPLSAPDHGQVDHAVHDCHRNRWVLGGGLGTVIIGQPGAQDFRRQGRLPPGRVLGTAVGIGLDQPSD